MTLLKHVVTDGPGVRALVIGVGRYPHLNGSTKARFSNAQDMRQLPSLSHSALAIANWLRTEHV